MELLPWKRFIVKASLLFLTCCIFNVMVAETLEDVCSSCHVNATCDDKMDGSGGKVCNCKYGFLGNGRTKCQDKDECQSGGGHICGDHTVCHNTYGSFYCTCLSGYSPSNNLVIFIPNDGTQCKDIDECKVQGICGEGGWCTNIQGDFSCRCQTGYKVQNGSQPFHPHRDKTFCKAIDCGLPPSVPQGAMLSHTGTRHGSVARFSCSQGFFQKRGNSTATCGEKGVWEGLSLVCEEIDCGDPPVLPHSVRAWDKLTTLGSKVYYTCRAGFYSIGDGNISICTESGKWKKASMQCEEIKCGDPPVLPHSGQVWNGSTNLGSTVSYYCKEGFYQARGGGVSLCVGNGYWTNPTLVCKETQCGPPPEIQSLVMQWDGSVSVGSVSRYSCQEGFYKLTGSDASVCTTNGQWQTVTLACREIDCGNPPSFPHSLMLWNNSTKTGTEVAYQCKAGFHNAGHGNVSVCTANGHWKHASILCEDINCGPPAVFPNADMHWDNSSGLGSVVHYTCKNGFYLESEINHSTCTSAREWERITVTCKEVDCGEPPVVPHTVRIWNGSAGAGTVARYRCRTGFYSAAGRSVSVCTDQGRWTGAPLQCEEINCGPPPVFPNTDMHWDNSSGLGSVVRYTCKNRFYLESEINHSTCTSAREWERIIVTCKGADNLSSASSGSDGEGQDQPRTSRERQIATRCGPPPSLPHSEVEWHNGSSPGSVALHRCRSGYRSWRGRARSVCDLTGTWQPATLLCKEIRPAISKLAVFRENCLRWKAEKKDPHGEDYTVHMVGSREYQRTFRDVRQRAFSSASDWPELCLTLLPATNYTVNITALAASFSATVSVNTSIHAPPVPEVAFKYVEVPLPSLWLRRSINTLDPISVYQVFVVPLDGRVEFDCRSASQPLFHSQRPSAPYVAAQIPVGSIGREFTFTLGDRRYYGEYYNAPLQPGRDYYIILRVVSQWGRVRKQSCVFWAKARGTSYIIQSATMIAGGLVGLVGFVVFLGFAHVWYCQKK